MKELYIIAGANGSGKTTLSKQIMEVKGFDFLNADEIAKTLSDNIDAQTQVKAGRVFFENLEKWLSEGKSFILESTLSGKYLNKVIENAKNKDYEITIVYVFLESPQECIERIATRVKNGGHHIPDEDVIRRFYRSKENFWNNYRFLADKWSIFYNGFEYPHLVISADKNEFSILDDFYFNIFQKDI